MKNFSKNLQNNIKGLFLPNEEYGIKKSIIFYIIILILFQIILTFMYMTDNLILLLLSYAISNIVGLVIGFLIFWVIYAFIIILIISFFAGVKKEKNPHLVKKHSKDKK